MNEITKKRVIAKVISKLLKLGSRLKCGADDSFDAKKYEEKIKQQVRDYRENKKPAPKTDQLDEKVFTNLLEYMEKNHRNNIDVHPNTIIDFLKKEKVSEHVLKTFSQAALVRGMEGIKNLILESPYYHKMRQKLRNR